jgi:hypothetical protein
MNVENLLPPLRRNLRAHQTRFNDELFDARIQSDGVLVSRTANISFLSSTCSGTTTTASQTSRTAGSSSVNVLQGPNGACE